MSSSLFRRNDALAVNGNTVNGKTADISITNVGSDFYYAICTIMGCTSLLVLGLSYLKPRSDRLFFYLTAALNATACIAYFSMGSNLGMTPIDVEYQRSSSGVAGMARAIFYARYIDWVVTTPLLLLDLLLTAGVPWQSVVWVIFLDEAMIVTGLIGALTRSSYKWGFYAFGCIAMLGVFYELVVTGRSHAKALGNDVHRVFITCGVLTLFIWLLYPVAWGVSEGANLISPNGEAIFYGILDFIAKPIFSAALIFGHWNIDPARMGCRIRTPTEQAQRVSEHTNANTNTKHHHHGVENNNHTSAVATGNNYGGNNTTSMPMNTQQNHHDSVAPGNLQTPSAGFNHINSGQAPVYDNVTSGQPGQQSRY